MERDGYDPDDTPDLHLYEQVPTISAMLVRFMDPDQHHLETQRFYIRRKYAVILGRSSKVPRPLIDRFAGRIMTPLALRFLAVVRANDRGRGLGTRLFHDFVDAVRAETEFTVLHLRDWRAQRYFKHFGKLFAPGRLHWGNAEGVYIYIGP